MSGPVRTPDEMLPADAASGAGRTPAGRPVVRPRGSQVMRERFPTSFSLWQLAGLEPQGFPNPFLLTALQINGRVVLLQEFGGAHDGSWDVYVPATDSGKIEDTVEAVGVAVGAIRKVETESAAEHVRNALQLLAVFDCTYSVDGKRFVVYQADDIAAVTARLRKALGV